ncbi:hypothetical protein C5167_004607 [Papaver somniferum]|uniref:Uncharacterized protein n=1 Tax=Papaver somniferum TaxID=3469 RepID=A0A4Y7JBA8_PAPSO|nr:hypothetical protein C5167_004607 [Papaver somniferum]
MMVTKEWRNKSRRKDYPLAVAELKGKGTRKYYYDRSSENRRPKTHEVRTSSTPRRRSARIVSLAITGLQAPNPME